MTRFAGLLLVLLPLFVSACSNLTEEEMAQLTFIAEEALIEVAGDAPSDLSKIPATPSQTAAPATAASPAGQTRRSVASAVSAKIPLASPQGADASVWQARTLVDALNLDPSDHKTCFRILGRSFFNRCDQAVDAQTCDDQGCLTYRVPAGGDLTIPHDYASLTPNFVPSGQLGAKPGTQSQAKPQAREQAQANPQKATAKAAQQTAKSKQLAKAQASSQQQAPAAAVAMDKPEAQAIPPGVPQDIKPEPAGSDLASTEFFKQGGFPLSF